MDVIVLHNLQDKGSREFVAGLPNADGNTYYVIDWYGVHDAHGDSPCTCYKGGPYPGPSPSAFPELVIFDAAPPPVTQYDAAGNTIGTVPGATSWVSIRAAQSTADLNDRSKYET